MAKGKQIVRISKLQFDGGGAKPGPALAGLGLIMPEFCTKFNDATKDRRGEPVPVEITVYKDKSFDFKTFTAPASFMIKKIAGIKKGASNSKTEKIATLTKDQIKEIAEYKKEDLNSYDIEAAIKIIAGTAKNMGVLVEGLDDVNAEIDAAKKAEIDMAKGKQKAAELEKAANEVINSKDKEIVVNATSQKEEGEK